MDDRYSPPSQDDAGDSARQNDRRGPGRPQGDSRLPAHIMAAVRDTIRVAAATCVDASRLESSGPYEWLAIVEAHDDELYQLLRRYIESCRYVDELEHHAVDLGRTRLADAVRDASFARESMKEALRAAIKARRPGEGLADV
ncbi:MAG TPA: hypothetical protein VGP25_10275 [Gemmatimonadaceae bacterium]|jgi:hypothetical protein|nr:hypothetical protein [Gemmatimonadaceae bacterium]